MSLTVRPPRLLPHPGRSVPAGAGPGAGPGAEADAGPARGEPTLDAGGDVPRQVAWAVLGLAVAWLAVLLALRWPVLTHPGFVSNSPIDTAFFAYAGDVVRRGGTPYLSFWDHKPPLVYFINAAALTLSGGALWGLWAASLAALVATLVAGYAAMRRLFGAAPALLASVYFAVAAQSVLAVGMTEGFAPPLQWLAILAFVWWLRGGRPFGVGAALGAAAGLLALLRPNLIGAPLAVGLLVAGRLTIMRDGRRGLALAAGALAGAAAALAPVALYLWSRGALDAFRDQVVRYNALYVAASWGRRVRAAYVGLRFTGLTAPLLLPAAGWLLAVARLARGPERARRPALLLVALWLPLEVALAAVSGRSYAHYFVLAYPPLTLAVAALAAELRGLRTGGARRPVPVLAALGLALAVPAVVDLGLWVDGGGVPHRRADQLRAVTRWLDAHTPAAAPIYVWGHAADVYFFSHRRPASRFVYALPLLTPGYATPARIDSFLAEVRRAAPTAIVDATPNARRSDALVPSLGRWNPRWRYPAGSRRPYWRTTPALRRFYQFVAAEYVPTATVGRDGWVVYQRRNTLAPGTAPILLPADSSGAADTTDTTAGDAR